MASAVIELISLTRRARVLQKTRSFVLALVPGDLPFRVRCLPKRLTSERSECPVMIWSVSTCILNQQSISPQNNLFTWYLNGATVNYGIGDTDSMSADLRPPATFDFTAAPRGAASRVRNFESQVWHGSADSSRRKCVRLASRSDDEFVPHELMLVMPPSSPDSIYRCKRSRSSKSPCCNSETYYDITALES